MNTTFFRHLALRALWAASAILATAGAHADDWAHRKNLSLDTSANGIEVREELTELPVLLRLHSGNFKFAEAKPDGADLRVFAADGKTALSFHIEHWDAANELASVWIKVPKVAPSAKATVAVLAWGNPAANAEGNSGASYATEQAFVIHFDARGGVVDASAAKLVMQSSAKPVAAGPIGAAAAFDGRATVELPTAPTIAAAKGMTFTAWVKPASAGNATLYEQRDGGKTLTVGLAGGMPFITAGGARVAGTTPLAANEWTHVAAVADGAKATLYVNGAVAGSGAFVLPELGGSASIGAGLAGEMDEVALAVAARSAGFIAALADSQSPDSLLVAFGDDGEEGGEINYFAILIGAVTIDGWIVIGLLGVMAVLSFYVMISKAMMLSRTNKANKVFLSVYKEKATRLLDPDSADAKQLADDASMLRSSVFRMYQTGLHEVASRVGTDPAARKPLSGPGADAVRATLDAAMLRENQKFNSGMVLLTISIAGGPFLGLLGTVVGVMITFAAIAAAGDVNVNSIAPGIAAALVATVAGLAVAIPALFGYNWLAAQIKNASSDTQVFLDEFLTRSAELYAD